MIKQEPMCDDEQLLRVLRDVTDSSDSVEILDHVESCQRCQQRLDELAADEAEFQKTVDVLSSNARDVGPDGFYSSSHVHCFHLHQPAWTDSMARQLLSPPSHPEMLGRIGRYDVERLIGSGGMGVVFKAHDTELNRPVAVKLLAPYLAQNGSARKRFAREARAAAAVVDDHVVPIHNVETDDEHPFLVMKYIAGGSLQQRLDREGPLDVCEVLRIGMQTAKGLASAHAQGLIHRDVKPSNILLDEGVDRALLTDFGLARATDDASLTRSGFHPGTPHYMSPEQVRGEVIDARSDLFGLGCVLYSLCTGHPPFRSETSYAVLRRITDDSPRPIRETNPDVPAWLEQIVMKLLAKSREDRFDSAEQVAGLLEDCLAHLQQPTSTPLPEPVAELAKSFGSPGRTSASLGGFRFPPIGKVIVAAAFAFSLIFAGVLIVLELNKGTLRIESDVDDIEVRITHADEIVDELAVTKSGENVRISAGEYVVAIVGDSDGLTIHNGRVTLRRADTEVVRIILSDESSRRSPPMLHDRVSESDAQHAASVKPVDFVLGKSNLSDGDQIEIQSVTSSGRGFEVGATVTVKGTYSLSSEDAAVLGFFSTQLPGETPTPTPVQPSQQMKAKRGKHTFTLSKVIRRIGSPHVTFYHPTTGNGMGGVYFSESEKMASEKISETEIDITDK